MFNYAFSSSLPPPRFTPAKAKDQIINLKLLIHKRSNKVLCAEASKEFVDFLFGLLQIPMGSIIRLLRQNKMHMLSGNSFDRIYGSVEKLEKTYFESNPVKESLLIPTMASSASLSSRIPPMLKNFVPLIHDCKTDQLTSMGSSNYAPSVKKGNNIYSAPLFGSPSPSPFGSSSSPSFPGSSPSPSLFGTTSTMSSSAEGKEKITIGFVKEDNTKFMVVDNLMVTPWSDISLFTLINKFSIKDFNSLEEKNVKIDFKKSLELVKTSFESDTVLTDVFIGKPDYLDLDYDDHPDRTASGELAEERETLDTTFSGNKISSAQAITLEKPAGFSQAKPQESSILDRKTPGASNGSAVAEKSSGFSVPVATLPSATAQQDVVEKQPSITFDNKNKSTDDLRSSSPTLDFGEKVVSPKEPNGFPPVSSFSYKTGGATSPIVSDSTGFKFGTSSNSKSESSSSGSSIFASASAPSFTYASGTNQFGPPRANQFGSKVPSIANPFQFGSQLNQMPPQNPSQASGSLEVNSGGSFPLGTGGPDKSNRKFTRIRKITRRK